MPVALFGIDDGGLNLAVNLLVLFLVVIWLALVVWTYLDARRRIDDRVLVICATAASLFPFVGTIVYAILRPPEFTEDRRERELEIRAAQLRVRQLNESSCPNCEYPIERTYLRCPNCQARVKDPCPSCSKPLDPRWSMCPYCETPVQPRARRGAAPRRTRPAGQRPAAAGRGQRPATRSGQRAPSRTGRSGSRSGRPQPREARPARPASEDGSGEEPRSRSADEPRPAEEQRSRSGEERPRPAGEERPRPTPTS